jgi:hypothetical protein
MSTVQVRVRFVSGAIDYTLPHVYAVSDPQSGMKATVIHGNRSDGAIIIPGGRKSIEINVKGRLFDNDGYNDITTLMSTMRTNLTTDVGTLYLQHYSGTWITDWSFQVRRIDEISFPESLRITDQEYEVRFLVLVY